MAPAPPEPMTAPATRVPAAWAGERRPWLLLLVALGLGQSVLSVVLALGGRALVDAPTPQQVWPALGVMVAALIGVALARFFELRRAEALAQHYIAQVRLVLFDALASLPMVRPRFRSRGGVLLRFTGDAQALRTWVGRGIAQTVAGAGALVALLGGLAWLDAALAAIGLAWCAAAAGAMRWTLPALASAARDSRSRQATIAANMHDRIATLPLMQSAGQSARERKRLDQQNRRAAASMQSHASALARHRLTLDAMLTGLAVSVVVHLTLDHPGSTGLTGPAGMGTLVGAIGLIGLLAAPLRRIGAALATREVARVAERRIEEFLAEARPAPDSTTGAPLGAAPVLRLDALCVDDRLGPLDGLTRVAVIGASGSGKSLLLAALAGLTPATQGRVLLDDVPLERIDPAARGHALAYVSPDLPPLRGSVRRNLTYRWSQADAASVEHAMQLAGWRAAPKDDRRRVADAGVTLSGDERRALALARALLGAPAVLLIDEIEHCLPAPRVASLRRLLDGYRGSLVFSTADAACAALADEIWTLEGGQRGCPGGETASLRLVRTAAA
jgi:ATP-binding cassette, subfamily B, bacterial